MNELDKRVLLLYRAKRAPNEIARLCGIKTLSALRSILLRNGIEVKWGTDAASHKPIKKGKLN